MEKENYIKRLLIPIDGSNLKLYTKSETNISIGYERIVVGERGPYIEFSENQINKSNIFIPEKEKYRLDFDCYYIEYRTKDYSNVKIYFQKKTVNYADYRVGFYYISPFDLKTDSLDLLVEPLNSNKNAKKFLDI